MIFTSVSLVTAGNVSRFISFSGAARLDGADFSKFLTLKNLDETRALLFFLFFFSFVFTSFSLPMEVRGGGGGGGGERGVKEKKRNKIYFGDAAWRPPGLLTPLGRAVLSV